MRVNLVHAVFGFVVSFLLAAPSFGQTLLPPGGAGDNAEKKPAQMKELEDAIGWFQKGDIDNAEKSCEEACKKNADLPPAQILIAQMFAQARQGQLMLVFLEKAVQKSPDDPEAYLQLGELALNQRRFAEADLLFGKASTLLKTFNKSADRKAKLMPRVFSDLAGISEVREDWAGNQTRLDEALKLDPKNVNFMQRKAKSLFMQKKAQEALEQLRAASTAAAAAPDANPNVLMPELQLAIFYLGFGDPDNAKTWVKKALEKAPKDKDARTRLEAAKVYLQTGKEGDFDEAKAQAAEALKIDRKSLEALMLRGIVSLFQKDYAGAVTYFEEATMQSPSNFEATNNLALALVELKDDSKKKRALEYASENVKKTQGSQNTQANQQNAAEALSTLGWVLYRIDPVKNLDDSDKLLRQAIGTNNYNPDTAYYAAVVGFANKRPLESKALLERALKSTVPWTMKNDAKALLEQLNKN
jgi:tetratricopeptide (TPR) repeat protein